MSKLGGTLLLTCSRQRNNSFEFKLAIAISTELYNFIPLLLNSLEDFHLKFTFLSRWNVSCLLPGTWEVGIHNIISINITLVTRMNCLQWLINKFKMVSFMRKPCLNVEKSRHEIFKPKPILFKKTHLILFWTSGFIEMDVR